MNTPEAAKLIAIALTIFPEHGDKDLKTMAQTWSMVMGDLSYQQAQQALVKVLRHSHFWPKPSEIIEMAKSMLPEGIPNAEDAWIEICKNLNPYKRPEWSHPVIEKAVKTMGYMQLCTSENPSIDRAQFLKIYQTLGSREEDRQENEVVVLLTSNGGLKLIRGME